MVKALLPILTAYAAMLGKTFAVAFYMELERRLGKSKYGSFLGLVFWKLSAIFGKSKQPAEGPKEEP